MFSITHLWAGVSLPTYNSSLSSLSSWSWSASLSPLHKTIIKLLQSPGNGGKNEWVWLPICLSRQLGSGWKLKPGSLMILAWPAWETSPAPSLEVFNLWHQSWGNSWGPAALVTALMQRELCSGACLFSPRRAQFAVRWHRTWQLPPVKRKAGGSCTEDFGVEVEQHGPLASAQGSPFPPALAENGELRQTHHQGVWLG